MKEYKIQMHQGGKWVPARTYFGSTLGSFVSRDHAERVMFSVEDAWHKKGSAGIMPERFRLMSREVSEWEVDAE